VGVPTRFYFKNLYILPIYLLIYFVWLSGKECSFSYTVLTDWFL